MSLICTQTTDARLHLSVRVYLPNHTHLDRAIVSFVSPSSSHVPTIICPGTLRFFVTFLMLFSEPFRSVTAAAAFFPLFCVWKPVYFDSCLSICLSVYLSIVGYSEKLGKTFVSLFFWFIVPSVPWLLISRIVSPTEAHRTVEQEDNSADVLLRSLSER